MHWFKLSSCNTVFFMIFKEFLRLRRYSSTFLVPWMQSEKDYEIVVKTLNSVYSIWPDFFFFVLFENGQFYNVVSTLTNVLKLDVEIENVVSTLSNINHTTLKYTTLIRRWFDVVLLRDVISTERNVETTLKFLLGKNSQTCAINLPFRSSQNVRIVFC